MKRLYSAVIEVPIAVLAESHAEAVDLIQENLEDETFLSWQETEVDLVTDVESLPKDILSDYYNYIPYGSETNKTVGAWLDENVDKIQLAEAVLDGETDLAEQLATKVLESANE